MKKWLYVLLSLIISSCLPCETITIENGPLPDSALKFVPYQNGETYHLKHSNGLIINFVAQRETNKERTYCSECCKYVYHYEVNSTRLVADYPIFDCNFEISNLDTTHLGCHASIGKSGFTIPTSVSQLDYFEKVDSLTIDSITHYDVFKLKSNYGSFYDNDSIYVDSLYYNFQSGILKILMSNDEYYEINR